MDRNEAIELLKNMHWSITTKMNREVPSSLALNMAIEALEQAPKWIPVSEKMPESADCPMDCLVTRKSKTIGNYTDMAVAESDGTWTHEDWEAIVLGDNVYGKKTGLLNTRDDEIIAWMSLPEPWKGEQHETD